MREGESARGLGIPVCRENTNKVDQVKRNKKSLKSKLKKLKGFSVPAISAGREAGGLYS